MGFSADCWQASARVFVGAAGETTKQVLSALARDPKVVAVLGSHPLGRVELSGGSRSGLERILRAASENLVVNPFRPPESYGKEFTLRSKVRVGSGRTLSEAMQRTLYHELGHHILDAAGPEARTQVTRCF